MRYWITTDTHFGHSLLSKNKMRPDDFEDKILKCMYLNILSTDILIHLGDVAFSNEHEWHNKLLNIKCNKWLLKGNHDKRSYTWYLDRGWNFVAETLSINLYGLNILFSHIPQKENGFDINIHGHFHDTDFRKHEPEIADILTGKHYLLALEYNGYQLWNLEKIIKKFKKERKL